MTAMGLIVVLLAAWVAMVANEWFPVLRFESSWRNATWALASYTLPWLALGLTLWRLEKWRRVAAMLMLVVPIAYTLILGPMVAMHLMSLRSTHGKDRSFQRVAAIPVDGGRIAIYRSDCGLPCGNEGIAVRHERRLVPGLLLVRRLAGFDGAHDARHDVIGPRRVRLSVEGSGAPRSRVYDVKPWVYF
jgi:hypothetical protein